MDAIRLEGASRLTLPAGPRTSFTAQADGSFGDLFKKVLSDTSELESGARGLIESFLRGEPVELHQVMAASEEASISLELLVELRNKLTDAYRNVMNVS